MQSLLDSTSRLINIKNRFGLRITEGEAVTTYTAQSRLRKFLVDQLTRSTSLHPIDRNNIVEKITLAAKNHDKINSVYELWNASTPADFIQAASGSARAFFTHAMKDTFIPGKIKVLEIDNNVAQLAFA